MLVLHLKNRRIMQYFGDLGQDHENLYLDFLRKFKSVMFCCVKTYFFSIFRRLIMSHFNLHLKNRRMKQFLDDLSQNHENLSVDFIREFKSVMF
jgi:hypothetical protein